MRRWTYNDPRMVAFVFAVCLLGYLPLLISVVFHTFADSPAAPVNEPTSYMSCIVDDADILSDEEEREIKEGMKKFSDQCHIVVASGNGLKMQTAQGYYSQYIPQGNSCIVLFLDINSQQLEIYCTGRAAEIINESHRTEITDNLYYYMLDQNYAGAIGECMGETYSIMTGAAVFAPMRYINNAFIALSLAAIIMFLFVHRSRDRISDADYDEKMQEYLRQTSRADFATPRFG